MSSRRFQMILPMTCLLALAINAPGAAQEVKQPPNDVRRELNSDNADRQRAAMVLIPELKLKGMEADDIAKFLEKYLRESHDDQGKVYALRAYGKLAPPPRAAAAALTNQLTNGVAAVKEAAGAALIDLIAPIADNMAERLMGINGLGEGIGAVAGPAVAFESLRAHVETQLDMDLNDTNRKARPTLKEVADSLPNYLPVCTLALKDPSERLKAAGADGVLRISQGVARVLPNTALFPADGRASPYEMKLRWVFMAPVLEQLSKTAPNLALAMTSPNLDTRKIATKAAGAVNQARSLARLNQRFEAPYVLQILNKPAPPDDILRESAAKLLPVLAERLQDESFDVRLIAIEAFEHFGADARSQLEPIVQSSTNSNLFVRWVATRTLGQLLPGAPPADAARIVDALRIRVEDSDIDVRNAALAALNRGGEASRPATDAVLRLAAKGDADQRASAIDTLEKIKADRVTALPVMTAILAEHDNRVRKEAIKYIGRTGIAAKSALPQLRQLLSNPNEQIREEAAKAILAIAKEL